jgi:hypothetical protein
MRGTAQAYACIASVTANTAVGVSPETFLLLVQ